MLLFYHISAGNATARANLRKKAVRIDRTAFLRMFLTLPWERQQGKRLRKRRTQRKRQR
jgi:hypothetical protein